MTEETTEASELIKCTVISCPNYFYKDLAEPSDDHLFFSFPSDRAIAKIWKEKCGVAADHAVKTAKVCSDHFRHSDYVNKQKTALKEDAVPRENLGWMFGMPEVKLATAPKFGHVKEAVDTNERLKARFEKMVQEQKMFTEKINLYKKKVGNVDKEILRLKGLIQKYPVKKKKNGQVETNLICKVFSQAQINMLMGTKKVVWSYDDMAMAFTLRHIGNRECYLYLKDTLNMPLPSLSAVQRWVASNKHK